MVKIPNLKNSSVCSMQHEKSKPIKMPHAAQQQNKRASKLSAGNPAHKTQVPKQQVSKNLKIPSNDVFNRLQKVYGNPEDAMRSSDNQAKHVSECSFLYELFVTAFICCLVNNPFLTLSFLAPEMSLEKGFLERFLWKNLYTIPS